MKRVRGPRIQAGCEEDRRAMLVLEGSANVCCEPGQCLVCAFTGELLSLPAEQEEGHLAVCIYVLCESYTVQLKAPPCLWQSVGLAISMSYMCLCATVCVCVSGTRTQLLYWLSLQPGKLQPRPSAWAETSGPLGHWAGLQQPGWRGPGLEQLEEVAMLSYIT